MNNLTYEEKKIIAISHVGWITIAYKLAPLMFLSIATTNSNIIFIEKIDAIAMIVSVTLGYIIDGIFFEKAWYKFFTKFILVLSIITLGFVLFANIYIKLAAVSLLVDVIFSFTSAYGAMYNEVTKSKLDIAYVFWIISFNAGFILTNIFGDIIVSYYASFIVSDILWFVLEYFVLLKKRDRIKMFLIRGSWKDFYKLCKRATLRKSGAIIYESIATYGAFLVLSNVKQDFALIVFILLRKTPTFKVLSCFVAQIKRVLLKGIKVDLKKLTISMFIFIAIEVLIVSILAVAVNQKGFSFDWGIMLLLILSQIGVVWVQMQSDIKQLFLERDMYFKEVLEWRLVFAIFVLGCRVFMTTALIAYTPQIFSYLLLGYIYGKYLKKYSIEYNTMLKVI